MRKCTALKSPSAINHSTRRESCLVNYSMVKAGISADLKEKKK